MTTHIYRTRGTCSRSISVTLDDDMTVRDVQFVGGCHGNLQGVSKLVEGRKAQEVIKLLEGLRCGAKPTSCPDQLSKALQEALAKN